MVEPTQPPTDRFVAGHSVQKGATYWFTGLSGAGKSTLSEYVKNFLDKDLGDSKKVFILDGDVIRTGLNKDLGFDPASRAENIRRISEVSKLFNMAGMIVFVAFISPYSKDRDFAKDLHTAAGLAFFEAYISASLETCEGRDVKGLYKKARDGTIPNFTGVTAPYEAPQNPDLNINTGEFTLEQCKNMVVRQMNESGVLKSSSTPRVVKTLVKEPTEEEAAAHEALPVLNVERYHVELIQTIGEGWAFPLKRFMNDAELLEMMQMQTLTDDTGRVHIMPVPLTLTCSNEEKEALSAHKAIALRCPELGNHVLAVLEEPVFYANRKEEIATRCFGTRSLKHPMIEKLDAQGDWNVSCKTMKFVKRVEFGDGMDSYRKTPEEIHNEIVARGADAVYAFQVRNPLHNGHVLLLKDTREQLLKQGYKNPVLLLHPLGGWCKDDDVPLDYRMNQHQALIDDGTLPKEHIILAVWPSPMFYGGPTEVLWHGSSRVNCGISHFITGRDPAGVKHPEKEGDLYDVWHGQKLLVHQKSLLNGVEVVPFKVAALHKATSKMDFFQPGVSKGEDFDFISGSRMRQLAKDGEEPPAGFMSPGGWKVLSSYYKSLE